MKKLILALTVLNASLAFGQTSQLNDRKALIIGISEYGVPADILHGVPHDMDSAAKIAQAMGIPEKNITYIREKQATKSSILSALRAVGDSTTEGTRAFVYFSGHGTRYPDPKTGNCTDGLLTYDGQAITNAEFANAAQKLTQSTDLTPDLHTA